jgi:methylmalonyl-CoA/ethylmalonyl-CoA epimerase
MKLEHVGIAVDDLEKAVEAYSKLLGSAASEIKEVADQKVKVVFLEAGGAAIELLEPTDDSGPIAKFLAKKGPGMHHLSFSVEDIEAKLDQLKAAGYSLIDEIPRIGASGKKIAFLHPKSTSGVLIELEEE